MIVLLLGLWGGACHQSYQALKYRDREKALDKFLIILINITKGKKMYEIAELFLILGAITVYFNHFVGIIFLGIGIFLGSIERIMQTIEKFSQRREL